MDKVGRDFQQRRQGKDAIRQMAMGHDEAFVVDDLIFVKGNIDIDESRGPAIGSIYPSDFLFDLLKAVEKFNGIERGFEFHRRVEISGLIDTPPGLGFVESAGADKVDAVGVGQSECGTSNLGGAVALVGSQYGEDLFFLLHVTTPVRLRLFRGLRDYLDG